jgi:hypothetical protein
LNPRAGDSWRKLKHAQPLLWEATVEQIPPVELAVTGDVIQQPEVVAHEKTSLDRTSRVRRVHQLQRSHVVVDAEAPLPVAKQEEAVEELVVDPELVDEDVGACERGVEHEVAE